LVLETQYIILEEPAAVNRFTPTLSGATFRHALVGILNSGAGADVGPPARNDGFLFRVEAHTPMRLNCPQRTVKLGPGDVLPLEASGATAAW
jgi:hypothetical protein